MVTLLTTCLFTYKLLAFKLSDVFLVLNEGRFLGVFILVVVIPYPRIREDMAGYT